MSLAEGDVALIDHLEPRYRLRLDEGPRSSGLRLPIMLDRPRQHGHEPHRRRMVAALFGTDALAAVAVGSDLYSIVFYLGAGMLGGLAPFYAAAVARADAGERARLERIGWLTVGAARGAARARSSGPRPIWLARARARS